MGCGVVVYGCIGVWDGNSYIMTIHYAKNEKLTLP